MRLMYVVSITNRTKYYVHIKNIFKVDINVNHQTITMIGIVNSLYMISYFTHYENMLISCKESK